MLFISNLARSSLIPRHFQPPHSLFVMIIPSHQSFFKTQVKRHSSRRLHYNVYLPPVTALLNLIPLVCSTGLQRFIWFSINRTLNFKSDFRRNVAVQLLSCLPLFCHFLDCSSSGSSVHGISQARTLEWLAISFSRGDRTCVSCIGRQILNHCVIWEAPQIMINILLFI